MNEKDILEDLKTMKLDNTTNDLILNVQLQPLDEQREVFRALLESNGITFDPSQYKDYYSADEGGTITAEEQQYRAYQKQQQRKLDLSKYLLDPTKEIEEDPALIWARVEDVNYKLFTAGDISVISGAAKSRKTFFLSAITAAAINGVHAHVKPTKEDNFDFIQDKELRADFIKILTNKPIQLNRKTSLTSLVNSIRESSGKAINTTEALSYIDKWVKRSDAFVYETEKDTFTIRPATILNMYGTMPEGKDIVIYFDTEQSTYHAQKVNKRICKLAGKEAHDNFRYYKLRGLSGAECLEVIRAAIEVEKDRVSFVCIDGIADLLSQGINNETEATQVILEFMRMTEEMNIHICTILHTNKEKRGIDGTLTGWIGTILLKKATTIINVKKDPEKRNVSYVTPTETRELCFESFAFEIDQDGMPQPTSGTPTSLPDIKAILSNEDLAKILIKVNSFGKLNKSEFTEKIRLEIQRIEDYDDKKIVLNPTRRRLTKLIDSMLYDEIITELKQGKGKAIEVNLKHPFLTGQTNIEV